MMFTNTVILAAENADKDLGLGWIAIIGIVALVFAVAGGKGKDK